MPYSTLITAEELAALLASDAPPLVLDCSFDLLDTDAGEHAYEARHVPGALYAHLDRDLSAPKTGRNGRHPLPDRAAFAATLGRWGLRPGRQVVAYDEQGSANAARAWWMLRWMGHAEVAVLDGGLAAWGRAGGRLTDEVPAPAAAPPYPERPPAMPTIATDALLHQLGRLCVLDARSAERFRGEVEPFDPVAGRIPGARLRYFKDNLAADGRFRPAAELRAAFAALGAPAGEVVHQCGSGVTACHNLLAMEHAGITGSVLYPGSWSEWCADPSRPVERG